jgi:hypothetical protein
VVRKGIRGLLIDPWNYIEHKVPKGYTETQYISECFTEIKTFAIKTGIHVFLIAHPTKLKKEHNGKYEVPTLYNISGSAHFLIKQITGSQFTEILSQIMLMYMFKKSGIHGWEKLVIVRSGITQRKAIFDTGTG